MKTKTEAKQNLEEFLQKVNAEFGEADWEKKKAQIAEETGAHYVGIRKDVTATKYIDQGYIYTPHVGRTRFTVKMRPEDVGLDPKNPAHAEFIEKYSVLGSKLLLPAEMLRRLDQIEQKIRRTIDEKYGIPTKIGAFVPFKNVKPMKEELKKLEQEYYAVRDEIVDNYEELKKQTEEFYKKFAVEAYRLVKKDPSYRPTDEEVKKFVDATMAYFPTAEEIYSSFYVEIEADLVATTEFLTSQQERLELIRERAALYRREIELIEKELTEDERVQAEREKNRLLIEKERKKVELQKLKTEEDAIREALEQKKKQYAKDLEETFADISGAIHGIIYDTLTRVNEALKTHGTLRPADTKSLSNLIEKVRTLMFTDDPDVKGWLLKIESIVETPPQKRDPEDIRMAVETIREQAGRIILSLGRAPRTLRGADLVDIEAALADLSVSPRQKRQLEFDLPVQVQESLERAPRSLAV